MPTLNYFEMSKAKTNKTTLHIIIENENLSGKLNVIPFRGKFSLEVWSHHRWSLDLDVPV